ncbi:MAG TPA: MYXO-CTERM sorting domain-containing protein, partial [Polyangiaceae bacterium]|nr:MYXO-CTERM sorting domain-containing protein [Polyangiaceae bacterium]
AGGGGPSGRAGSEPSSAGTPAAGSDPLHAGGSGAATGAPGTGGTATNDAGSGTAEPGSSPPPSNGGGCACSVAKHASSPSALALASLLGVLAGLRRKGRGRARAGASDS